MAGRVRAGDSESQTVRINDATEPRRTLCAVRMLCMTRTIFIRRPHELDRLLRKQCHVFVCSVLGNIRVRATVECDQDVQQHDHGDEPM